MKAIPKDARIATPNKISKTSAIATFAIASTRSRGARALGSRSQSSTHHCRAPTVQLGSLHTARAAHPTRQGRKLDPKPATLWLYAPKWTGLTNTSRIDRS